MSVEAAGRITTIRSSWAPLLLRPKSLAFRHYWRASLSSPTQRIRDGVIALFAISVMVGIYRGSLWMLTHAESDKTFVYLHPSLPLGLIFLFLLSMLLLSNAATALASLYLANDLDLILSSPLNKRRFFFNKFTDVLFSSSWVTIVFLFPALCAFAAFYQPPLAFYPLVLAVLVPYFLIPTAASIVFVTIYARLVPANRTRETMAFVVCSAVVFIYLLLTILAPASDRFSFRNLEDILRLVALLSIPNVPWIPSYWAATCLAEYLVPTKLTFAPHFVLLYTCATGLVALAFVCIHTLHFEAYSKANTNRNQLKVNSRRSQARWRTALFFVPPPQRAMIIKESKLFFRDITQIFQLILLSGICIAYFYNFRLLHAIKSQLPLPTQAWWDGFLYTVNNSLEAFLITAAGTRFVYLSISLEGRSFWVLQTSPLSIREIIRAKFIAWFIPIAVILSAVFGVGAWAITPNINALFLKVVTSWITCYAIVGLGVGLGAHFANFNWEHASQLVASFGSLVYMLVAIVLITVDGLLFGAYLYLNELSKTPGRISEGLYMASSIALLLGYLVVNLGVARWAMQLGERTLERQRLV